MVPTFAVESSTRSVCTLIPSRVVLVARCKQCAAHPVRIDSTALAARALTLQTRATRSDYGGFARSCKLLIFKPVAHRASVRWSLGFTCGASLSSSIA